MNPAKIPLKKRVALDIFKLKRTVDSAVHDLNYLFWECTLRCSLSCVHCGSDCTRDSTVPDMPKEDFLKILDLIAPHVDPHKVIVAITGGEPLMRTDLEECGGEISARGFPWGCVTNGWAMTQERLDAMLAAGLRSITISLDGLEESHDWFRGRKLSFQRALHAIEMVARSSITIFDIATCAHGKSFDELCQIRDLLIERGVKRWRLFTVFPKGRAAHNPDLQISDRQFYELFQFIKETRREGNIRASYGCEGFLGGFEMDVRDTFFACMAGTHIGSVLVDGSISACPSLRADYIQGNIYKDNFWEVWNTRYQRMRNRAWTKTGACASCKVYKWCKGNGLHLRDEHTGELLTCHYNRLIKGYEDLEN